jgi:hypothetical protein
MKPPTPETTANRNCGGWVVVLSGLIPPGFGRPEGGGGGGGVLLGSFPFVMGPSPVVLKSGSLSYTYQAPGRKSPSGLQPVQASVSWKNDGRSHRTVSRAAYPG